MVIGRALATDPHGPAAVSGPADGPVTGA